MTSYSRFTPSSAHAIVPFLSFLASCFCCWGLVVGLNSTMIPIVKLQYQLTATQAMLLQFCFYSSYVALSLPITAWCNKIGLLNGVRCGLSLTMLSLIAISSILPSQHFVWLIIAFSMLAIGITFLQVCANPLIALISSQANSTRHFNIAQAANSLGTTLSPLLLLVWFGNQHTLTDIASTYRLLALVCVVILLISLVFESPTNAVAKRKKLDLSILQQPLFRFGCLALFCYVGVEVMIASNIGLFMQTRFTTANTSLAILLFWLGALFGRLLAAFTIHKFNAAQLVKQHCKIAMLTCAMLFFTDQQLSILAFSILGLMNSILFPTIFSLSLKQVNNAQTTQASSLLCMAIVGGAIMPLIAGWFTDVYGVNSLLLIAVCCYRLIFKFAHKTVRVV